MLILQYTSNARIIVNNCGFDNYLSFIKTDNFIEIFGVYAVHLNKNINKH